MGLVRVTSHKHAFGVAPLTTDAAWANLRKWMEVPGVSLWPEPIGLLESLDSWVKAGFATPRNWTDLYLAAFATCHQMRLVTFDLAFRNLPGIDLVILDQ